MRVHFSLSCMNKGGGARSDFVDLPERGISTSKAGDEGSWETAAGAAGAAEEQAVLAGGGEEMAAGRFLPFVTVMKPSSEGERAESSSVLEVDLEAGGAVLSAGRTGDRDRDRDRERAEAARTRGSRETAFSWEIAAGGGIAAGALDGGPVAEPDAARNSSQSWEARGLEKIQSQKLDFSFLEMLGGEAIPDGLRDGLRR